MAKTFIGEKSVREPLFRVEKRDGLPFWKKSIIYGGAIIIALLLGSLICTVAGTKGNPVKFFSSLFKGGFGKSKDIWETIRDTALLLSVSMALLPAFKMKFWNLGGNGQILMGGLAANICLYYLGGRISEALVIIISLLASMLFGALWAVIPAIFKAFFNANESLFTLMMNYIAVCMVGLFTAIWTGGRGSFTDNQLPQEGRLPVVGNQFVLAILVGAAIFLFMFVFLKFSKRGYEVSVVGDSPNTAKYIGINVKKTIIKTLILSGAICGIVGLMLTSGSYANTAIGKNTAKNMGFTAIMTTWLGNGNPLAILGTCFFVSWINKSKQQISMDFGITSDSFTNLVTGIIYFFIIACSFIVQYKVIARKKKKEKDVI